MIRLWRVTRSERPAQRTVADVGVGVVAERQHQFTVG